MSDTTPRREPKPVSEEEQNYADTLVVDESETATHGDELKTTAEVRQGHTGDHVRYILLFSFIGAFVALLGLYFLFLR